MTTTLRSTITAQLGWTWRDSAGQVVIVDSNRLQFKKDLADGTGSNQADAVWHVEDQSLATGVSTTLELDALEKSLFDDTIYVSFLKIKAIVIVNKNTSGEGHLLVGGAATDPWQAPFGDAAHAVKVMSGGALLVAHPRDGWDVEPGSRDLKITAVGQRATFDVAVLGTITDAGSSSSSSSGV